MKTQLTRLYVTVTALSCLFFSCSKKESIENDPNTVNQTENELLSKGWKNVKEIDLISLNKNLSGANRIMSTTYASKTDSSEQSVPINGDHLKQIGYDITLPGQRNNLKKVFAQDGITPDGLIFNSRLSVDGDSRNNAPAANVNIIVSPAKVIVNDNSIVMPDEVTTSYAINESNTESTITVSSSVKTGYKTSWHRKISSSFKLGLKAMIGIPLEATGEVYTEITVGGETDSGEESSQERKREIVYLARVPARSKKTIAFITKIKGSTVQYFFPITVRGLIQINYPSQVHGHYYWSDDIYEFPNFLPKNQGESGVAQAINNLKCIIMESPAVPITD